MGLPIPLQTRKWIELTAIAEGTDAFHCDMANGESISIAPMLGRVLRRGDQLCLFANDLERSAPDLLLKRKHETRSANILFATVRCVTTIEKSSPERFVELELPHSNAALTIYLSTQAIFGHFYLASGDDSPLNQLYEALVSHPAATLTELRLAWRLKSIEISLCADQTIKKAHVERAFNILANPELKDCYDRLRRYENALPVFPYGGCGSILVEGRLIEDGRAFIGNRILAFKPEMDERKVSILMRGCEFQPDRIVFRDSRRKLEVWLDGGLLPGLNWDPSWNHWKHWIRSRLEVEATFVTSAKERVDQGERIVSKWSVALPSRLRVTVPEGLIADIECARAFHDLLGRHSDLIRQIAAQIDSCPAEHCLVEKWFRDFNADPELRPQHVNWQPDYDEFYFEELRKRSKTWFLLRDEYLFAWHKILIAEIPSLGHATYLFLRPQNLEEFLATYAKTARDEVRRNRDEVASRLGFIGRVVRGRRKMRWLNEVLTRAGEQVERGNAPE